ncbi:MAG TPA: FecR family protein, partial [Steroidobacteraceae bacterium]|nr:FecR family protein [Steroidobacteraceae bacterium]
MRASTAVSMRPILSMIALALALFGAASTRADENDPPARAARLGFIQGSVSFNPAGTQDWVAAPLNRPLTTGDQLWADRGGRAELQLDGSSLRLGASTSMAFLNLSDQATQVQLTAGTLLVHVRHLYDQETYEIDTPNLAFTVLRAGTYRVTVDENAGTTTINVRRGQGEVTGGGTAYSLYEGEDDVFAGTDQLTETAQYQSPAPDSLDAWSDGRDNRWDNSASARYVSPDVVGYQDLDDHGSWTTTPEYGHVWVPRGVEPGWAPYQSGHWAYVPPWGYTWVDDQPWGFAPFHYGRWIHTGQAWGWCPAPPPGPDVVYVRPVYAPALVAWVTVGAGVAWFALGPREVYVPSYPVSREYVNAVNVSNTTVNTTIVNNVYNTTIINKTANNTNITYVNRNAPGAIVATSREAFAS